MTSIMPSILAPVIGSANKKTPTTVATIGSRVAIMDALLVSNLLRPLVYKRKGATVDSKQRSTAGTKVPGIFNSFPISGIFVMGIKPKVAKRKV